MTSPAAFPERARALLEAPNFAHVATLRRDGSIHGVIVWVDIEDGRILLNSAEGRAWPANVRRDPRITLTVPNSGNQYEFVAIRGRVAEVTADGAEEHIDRLAKKYLGEEIYPFRQPGETRLKISVEPEHVKVHGTSEET